jgi:hypothetical protein
VDQHGHADEHRRQGGQQPPDPSAPEANEGHRTGGLDLPQQQIGDEVAGQGEEQVHPEKAA